MACFAALFFFGKSFLFLFQPTRVVALERKSLSSVKLKNPLRNVVEEISVVSNCYNCAWVVLEKPLKPINAFGVEVVCGLIKQQQVGSREQQATQRNAALFTTGQLRHIRVIGWTTQGVHCYLDVAVKAPCVGSFDLCFKVGLQCPNFFVVSIRVAPHRHDFVVLLKQVTNWRHAIHHVAKYILGGVQLGFLLQEANGEAGCEASFT